MKRIIVFISILVITLSFGSCLLEDDEASTPKANLRIENRTGYTLSSISGGGAEWAGPYANYAVTEQKEIDSGNVEMQWTCNSIKYKLIVNIEKGNWRHVMWNCAATDVDTFEE